MNGHPFDARDIRPGMDVYTIEGRYLGTVLRVQHALNAPPTHRQPAGAAGGFTGESLGPASTAGLGNTGPFVQRRQTGFQTDPDRAEALTGSMTIGRWFGLIGRREIPVSSIWNVSMERVILMNNPACLAQAPIDSA